MQLTQALRWVLEPTGRADLDECERDARRARAPVCIAASVELERWLGVRACVRACIPRHRASRAKVLFDEGAAGRVRHMPPLFLPLQNDDGFHRSFPSGRHRDRHLRCHCRRARAQGRIPAGLSRPGQERRWAQGPAEAGRGEAGCGRARDLWPARLGQRVVVRRGHVHRRSVALRFCSVLSHCRYSHTRTQSHTGRA